MIGPADLEAWNEDAPEAAAATSARDASAAGPSVLDHWRRRGELMSRLAAGRVLTTTEWRELRGPMMGRRF